MKILLLSMGLLVSGSYSANATNDSIPVPAVIQLAKITKAQSKSKFWILYRNPADLIELEQEGYTILRTKVKMIRNNQFWLDMWQSSLQMAVGYIIAKGGKNQSKVILPTIIQKPEGQIQMYFQY